MVLKKNGVIFETMTVPYRSHAAVLIQDTLDSPEGEGHTGDEIQDITRQPLQDGLIIQCPTFPVRL